MHNELVSLVKELTSEILEGEGRSSPELEEDTRLFGKEGLLDSMGIVSLVVALEQAIEDKYGASIALADERALSQTKGPYRTVGALADYAAKVMEDQG